MMAVLDEVVGFVRSFDRSTGLMNLRVERVICWEGEEVDMFVERRWRWIKRE